MILDEHQLEITKTKVKEFEQAVAKLNNRPNSSDINEKIYLQANIEAIISQLEEFRAEVAEYEELVR